MVSGNESWLRRFRPRVGSLLAFVVFVPTAAMIALAADGATDRWDERRLAARVHVEAQQLETMMEWRAALNDEWVLSVAVYSAAEAGIDVATLSDMLDIDVDAELQNARRRVAIEERADRYPRLGREIAAFAAVRGVVDTDGASQAELVHRAFLDLTEGIDDDWRSRLRRVRGALERSSTARQPGELYQRLDALRAAHGALVATMDRGNYANLILTGQDGLGSVAGLVRATGQYDTATAGVEEILGERGTAAWAAWTTSVTTVAIEGLIERITADALAGRPQAVSLEVYASLLTDGIEWLTGMTSVITAATADLADVALQRHDDAWQALVSQTATAAIAAIFAVAAGVALTGSVARPLRRLAEFAHDVGDGDFGRPPPAPRGPRELAQTTEAVADMTASVAAVEGFVIKLADDPTSADLDVPLPGRTGRALQTTVDHLRQSMRDAEHHRQKLEKLAASDGLTGLLNRVAALDAIDRELARCRRVGTHFTVLFIDLDGLKRLNDSHGHDVGDRAIVRTAESLLASTRRSDIVARLGGDEFLVAFAAAGGTAEAGRVAERIRRTVAEQPLAIDDRTLPLRCSIGVALAAPDDTAETVIRHADHALYRAKERGRDRVCWFSEPDQGALL